MNTQDIKKLANDYNHLALIKITTGYAFAIDELNYILNEQFNKFNSNKIENIHSWCLAERMADDETIVYYAYFDAYLAGLSKLSDFLMKYDTKIVAIVDGYDTETFDYLIDNDFYDFDHYAADEKEAAADTVADEEEELTISRVWKNKESKVTTALVNDVKIKPVPGRPFLWAGEDGYIYSELSFGNNGAKCRKGVEEYGGKGSRVRKLVIRYNDGTNSSNPYGRIVYPAFEWEYCDSHNLRVSRLVCSSYHGPAPFEGAVVDHIDGNKHNNRPDNLEWVTQAENLLRSAEAGRLLRGKDGRFVKQGECEDAVAAFTRGEADNHGRK